MQEAGSGTGNERAGPGGVPPVWEVPGVGEWRGGHQGEGGGVPRRYGGPVQVPGVDRYFRTRFGHQ